MKNSILSYNQREALKLGLTTDDLVFLDWFVHFRNSGVMEKKYIPEINDMGYWCSNKKILLDLPTLFAVNYDDYITMENTPSAEKIIINNKYKKKLQRFFNSSISLVVQKKTIKVQGGSKNYYYIVDDIYKRLISETNTFTGDKNVPCTEDKNVPCTGDKNVPSYTPIINTPIIDTSIYLSNNIDTTNKRVTYCSEEDKEVIDRLINELKEYTLNTFNDRELKRFINASFGDIELIKDVYDSVMIRATDSNKKPIKNLVNYIVAAIKKEIK